MIAHYGKISIEWDIEYRKHYLQHEEYFLKEIEYLWGYILQAIMWLMTKPKDREHTINIWMDFPDEISNKVGGGHFLFITLSEMEGKTTLQIFQVDGPISVGYVHIEDMNTFGLKDEEKIQTKILKALGKSEVCPS